MDGGSVRRETYDEEVEVVSGESRPVPGEEPRKRSRAGWYALAGLVILGLLGWMAYPYAAQVFAGGSAEKPAPARPVQAAAAVAPAPPSGAPMTVLLPNNMTVAVPNDWIRTDTAGRAVAAAATPAAPPQTLDVRRDTAYSAIRNDDKGQAAAILNARFYADDIPQKEIREASDADLKALDGVLRARIETSSGGTLLAWTGSERRTINGITALVSDYRRGTGTTAFRVRMVRVFDMAHSLIMTVEYREDRAAELKPVTDRIIASLARAPGAQEDTTSPRLGCVETRGWNGGFGIRGDGAQGFRRQPPARRLRVPAPRGGFHLQAPRGGFHLHPPRDGHRGEPPRIGIRPPRRGHRDREGKVAAQPVTSCG
ncbi:MAG TPA: hypothetical protein VF665_01240 [Longimicrobium sp.]|uniref:hypothetical protein n=1 Tax=Longimicrobium sp. TaxID=2029185 RepID=UPI002ED85D12